MRHTDKTQDKMLLFVLLVLLFGEPVIEALFKLFGG